MASHLSYQHQYRQTQYPSSSTTHQTHQSLFASQDNYDESLPQAIVPRPSDTRKLPTWHQQKTSNPNPDPDLLITPDKNDYVSNLYRFDTENGVPRARRSVHFDDEIQHWMITPEESTSDLSVKNSVRERVVGAATTEVASKLYDNEESDKSSVIKDGGGPVRQSKTVPVDVYYTHNQDKQSAVTKQLGRRDEKSNREQIKPFTNYDQTRPKSKYMVKRGYNYPFTSKESKGSKSVDVVESALAKPEYHTSLRVGAEIKQLQQSQLPVTEAVKHKLNISEVTRNKVGEKSAERVNTYKKEATFVDLQALEIPEDQLLDKIQQDIETVAMKAQQSTRSRRQTHSTSEATKEPDIKEFWHKGLHREVLDFSTKHITQHKPRLQSANSKSALDLYRRRQMWESRGSSFYYEPR